MATSRKKLSDTTKSYYEDLIGCIGDNYTDYRWKRHPVSRSHYRHTQKSVEFAFSHLAGPVDRLLEIGCGPGTWTDICLRNTKKMTIADISSEMLKLVHEKFIDKSIDLVCGDFISDNIALEGSFDVIFSARAVEYMDDKSAMVEKCARLLNAGGYLFIITKNPGWKDRKREFQSTYMSREGDIHTDWIGWQFMESLYRKEGLKNVLTFPVCLGSYYAPLNNRIGIKMCDLIYNRVYRRKINPRINFLAESYLTIGCMPL